MKRPGGYNDKGTKNMGEKRRGMEKNVERGVERGMREGMLEEKDGRICGG